MLCIEIWKPTLQLVVICLLMLSTCISFFFCSQPGLRYFCVCIGHSNPVPVGWVLKYCSKRPTFSASSTLDGQYLQQRYRWSSSDNRLKEAWTSSIWKRRRRGRKTLPVAVATTWGTSKLVSNLCSRRYSIKF